jgi:hypothetical protein
MPDAPAPREVNDVLIVAIGTAIWGIALIVALIIGAASKVIGVCAAGVGLGLWGLRYVRRRKARLSA